MQFPPDMTHDSVSVYNDRLIYTNTYDYEDTTQVPTTVLDIQNYQGQWSGGLDVGFTFNLPFFEHSVGCGDCTNTTTEEQGTFTVQI